MRLRSCLAASLLLLRAAGLSGCAVTGTDTATRVPGGDDNTNPIPGAAALRNTVIPAGGRGPLYLQVGDVLGLSFFLSPELDQNVIIRPDGKISLQLIGEQQAAGLTPVEFKAALVERYRGTLKNPVVEVTVRSFSPAHIYVGGEVEAPAEHEYTGRITASQAIIKSGGFTPDARTDKVVLVRYNGTRTPLFYTLDLGSRFENDGAGAGTDPPSCLPPQPAAGGSAVNRTCPGGSIARDGDMLLQPFDLVFISRTSIASVAQAFQRYINHILPVWQNLGFNWLYDLGRQGFTPGAVTQRPGTTVAPPGPGGL